MNIYKINNAILNAMRKYSTKSIDFSKPFEDNLLIKLSQKCQNYSVNNCISFNSSCCLLKKSPGFIIAIRYFEGRLERWRGVNYTILGYMKIQNKNVVIDNLKIVTHPGFIEHLTGPALMPQYNKIIKPLDEKELLKYQNELPHIVYNELIDEYIKNGYRDKIGSYTKIQFEMDKRQIIIPILGGPEDPRLLVDENEREILVMPNDYLIHSKDGRDEIFTHMLAIRMGYDDSFHFYPNNRFIKSKDIILCQSVFGKWGNFKNSILFRNNDEYYLVAWGYDGNDPFALYQVDYQTMDFVQPNKILKCRNAAEYQNFLKTIKIDQPKVVSFPKLRGSTVPIQIGPSKYLAMGHMVLEFLGIGNRICQLNQFRKKRICRQNVEDLNILGEYIISSYLNPAVGSSKHYQSQRRVSYFDNYFKFYTCFFYTFTTSEDDFVFDGISSFLSLPSDASPTEAIVFPTQISEKDGLFYISYGVGDDRTLLCSIDKNIVLKLIVPINNAVMHQSVDIIPTLLQQTNMILDDNHKTKGKFHYLDAGWNGVSTSSSRTNYRYKYRKYKNKFNKLLTNY